MNSVVKYSGAIPSKNHRTRNQIIFKTANYSNIAYLKYVTAISAIGLQMLFKKISNRIKGRKPRPQIQHPKDTVILYQFPRAYNTPSLSPFALKLETWLRAANIKYQNQLGMKRGGKGLIPFIKLNGYQIDDSQECIKYLTHIFNKDLNSHLTNKQRVVSHLVIKLCDDSLLWSMACFRLIHNPNGRRDINLPVFAYWTFAYIIGRRAKMSGYGRLTREELYDIAKKDLDTLEFLLSEKKFLFSDEKPCEADFAVFGASSQVIYNDTGIQHQYLKDKCPNIIRHNELIKRAYWSDWSKNIRKAEKEPLDI